MFKLRILIASCVLAALTFVVLPAGQAQASSVGDPPTGAVILDLNGTPIPHSYQYYSVNFTPTSAADFISFAFFDDPAWLQLSNVSLTLTGGGSNLLTNGDFGGSTYTVDGLAEPTGWTYLNNFGAVPGSGGFVLGGCGLTGNNCYHDGVTSAYDAITQKVSNLNTGLSYTLGFYLTETSSLSTFSAEETIGINHNGGNGIDLVAYAGPLEPDPVTPLPAALPLFATGLGAMGLFGWRRKRKNSAAIAAA